MNLLLISPLASSQSKGASAETAHQPLSENAQSLQMPILLFLTTFTRLPNISIICPSIGHTFII